jgi:hypothetical protein
MKTIIKTFIFLMAVVLLTSVRAQKVFIANNGMKDISHLKDSGANIYKKKAEYIYHLIMLHYSVPGTDFLAENFPKQPGDKKVAYMWSLSGMVTGMGILRQLGVTDSAFKKIETGIDKYWSDKYGFPGVESYPPIYGEDKRFYDDNATIGLDYLENYKATKNQHFLNQAEKCIAFDFTGESTDCDGGIFWNEDEKSPDSVNYIKATCSSSFSVTLALRLYIITKKTEYLEFGKRVYAWTKKKLQDPKDLIYWNDIAIKECIPNKTKWTYNSGAMLSNAVLLYQITKENQYFNDAKGLAAASFNFFTTSSLKLGRKFPDHDPWFTTVLFRGYLDFYKIDPNKNTQFIDAVIRNVDYAWKYARTPSGFFYEDWSGEKKGRYYWLLNQACMVEMYGRIALFFKNNH